MRAGFWGQWVLTAALGAPTPLQLPIKYVGHSPTWCPPLSPCSLWHLCSLGPQPPAAAHQVRGLLHLLPQGGRLPRPRHPGHLPVRGGEGSGHTGGKLGLMQEVALRCTRKLIACSCLPFLPARVGQGCSRFALGPAPCLAAGSFCRSLGPAPRLPAALQRAPV